MGPAQWQDILVAARAGDMAAWGSVYERFEGRVFALCLRLLKNPTEAEDATSECFERAHRALHRFDPERAFEPWLVSIASRHCLNRLRRRNTERRLFRDEAEGAPDARQDASPLVAIESERNRRALRESLDRLPDKYRLPLVLKYLGDQSYDEIAEQLGMTRNNVAVTLHRAKIALRVAMEGQSDDRSVASGRRGR